MRLILQELDERLVPNSFGGDDMALSSPTLTADMDGDGNKENITASLSMEGVPIVNVQNGRDVLKTLQPFESRFRGHIELALGSILGKPVIGVVAGDGGACRVKCYNHKGEEIVNDFGLEDKGFRGGGHIAFGDADGDGNDDLAVAAGEGGAGRIALHDGVKIVKTGDLRSENKLAPDFFAGDPALRSGARPVFRDLDEDTQRDIVAYVGQTESVVFLGSKLVAKATIPMRSLPPTPAHIAAAWGIDTSYYTQYIDAVGIPVIATKNVRAEALEKAAQMVEAMIGSLPDIRASLLAAKVRFVVIPEKAHVMSVPEYAHLDEIWHVDDVNSVDGMGPIDGLPLISAREKRILQPYDNILVHEIAHAFSFGLDKLPNGTEYRKELQKLFNHAMQNGTWGGSYASTNSDEYWAECVQSYFNVNGENDVDHGYINTAEEFLTADPEMYAFVDHTFHGVNISHAL